MRFMKQFTRIAVWAVMALSVLSVEKLQAAWSTASQLLETTTDLTNNPRCGSFSCINASGVSFVLYTDYTATPTNVVKIAKIVDGAVSSTETIDVSALTPAGENPNGVGIAVVDSKVVAVWRETVGGFDSVLRSVYSTDSGTTWSTPELLMSTTTSKFQSGSAMGMDGSGNVLVAWKDTDDQANETVAWNKLTGTTWGTYATIVDTTGDTLSDLSLAINSSGVAFLAWINDGTDDTVIYKFASGAWSSSASVNDPLGTTAFLTAPSVGVDASGNAFVIWPSGGMNPPYSYSYYNGTSWSTLATITPVTGEDAATVAVAMGPAGKGVILFSAGDTLNDNYTVCAAPLASGVIGTVTDLQTRSTPGHMVQTGINLQMNSDGNALALFSRLTATNETATIYSSIYDGANSSWGTVDTVMTGATTNGMNLPSGGINASEEYVATWSYYNGTNSYVLFSTLENTLEPPTNFTGRQVRNQYATFSELVNCLSWTASTSDNIASYKLSRGGTLIATLSNSKTSYNDHQRTAGVSYTYSLKAVDTDGNESSAVTVTVP